MRLHESIMKVAERVNALKSSCWSLWWFPVPFLILFGTSVAHADEFDEILFGPEWTFTNPEVAGADYWRVGMWPEIMSDRSYASLGKIHAALGELMRSSTYAGRPDSDKFKLRRGHDERGYPHVVIQYGDGIRVEFALDVQVIEVKMTAVTTGRARDIRQRIQYDVFDLLKKADNLEPRKDVGGGHTSTDFAIFRKHPGLLLRHFNDYQADPPKEREPAEDATLLIDMPERLQVNWKRKSEALSDRNADVRETVLAIKEFYYQYADMVKQREGTSRNWTVKNMGLNVEHIRENKLHSESNRLEDRSLCPQNSFMEWVSQIEKKKNRLRELARASAPAPPRFPARSVPDPTISDNRLRYLLDTLNEWDPKQGAEARVILKRLLDNIERFTSPEHQQLVRSEYRGQLIYSGIAYFPHLRSMTRAYTQLNHNAHDVKSPVAALEKFLRILNFHLETETVRAMSRFSGSLERWVESKEMTREKAAEWMVVVLRSLERKMNRLRVSFEFDQEYRGQPFQRSVDELLVNFSFGGADFRYRLGDKDVALTEWKYHLRHFEHERLAWLSREILRNVPNRARNKPGDCLFLIRALASEEYR